jgi:hypothetical protein
MEGQEEEKAVWLSQVALSETAIYRVRQLLLSGRLNLRN